MASSFNSCSMILLSLIFLIPFVPSSMARWDKEFRYTVCSRTTNPDACLNLDYVRTSSNPRRLTKAAIEVALAKGEDIHNQLNALDKTPKIDRRLKDIYFICSKNYNDAIRDLTVAKRSLDSKRYRIIPFELNDAEEEVKACKTVFDGASQDPSNINKANEEFYFLLEIAQRSSELLVNN